VDNYIYTSNLLYWTNITKDNFANTVNTGELLNLIKAYFNIDYSTKIGGVKNYYTNEELAVILDNLYHILSNKNTTNTTNTTNNSNNVNNVDTTTTKTKTNTNTNTTINTPTTTNSKADTATVNNKIDNWTVWNVAWYWLGGKIIDTWIKASAIKATVTKVSELEKKVDTLKTQNTNKVVNMNVVGDQDVNGDLRVKWKLFVNGKEVDPYNMWSSINSSTNPNIGSSDLTNIKSTVSLLMNRVNQIGSRMHKVVNPTDWDIPLLKSTGEVQDSGLNPTDFVRTTGNINQNITGDKNFKDNVVIDGNLVVKWTKTEVNTQSMTVTDKTITLNKNGTTATADKAWLKVQGDNWSTVASLTYDKNTNRWNDWTNDLARKSEIDHLDTVKADKVTNATAWNFAWLDTNWNLTDSGVKNSDLVHKTWDESISWTKTFTDGVNFNLDTEKLAFNSAVNGDNNILFNIYGGDTWYSKIRLDFRRYRGTKSNPTAAQEGDVLWNIDWHAFNGTNYTSMWGIEVRAGQVVDWQTHWIWAFNIHNANVWIWTSTPTEKLDVNGNIKVNNRFFTATDYKTYYVNQTSWNDNNIWDSNNPLKSIKSAIEKVNIGGFVKIILQGNYEVNSDEDIQNFYNVWIDIKKWNELRFKDWDSNILYFEEWVNLYIENHWKIYVEDDVNWTWNYANRAIMIWNYEVLPSLVSNISISDISTTDGLYVWSNKYLVNSRPYASQNNFINFKLLDIYCSWKHTIKWYIMWSNKWLATFSYDNFNPKSWFHYEDENWKTIIPYSKVNWSKINNTWPMFLGNTYFEGNVWIWTTTPTEKLDVNGNVKLTDPDTNNWIKDWDKCNHPWTITYDSNNDAFFGCINNKGAPEWKKLNN